MQDARKEGKSCGAIYTISLITTPRTVSKSSDLILNENAVMDDFAWPRRGTMVLTIERLENLVEW